MREQTTSFSILKAPRKYETVRIFTISRQKKLAMEFKLTDAQI